MANCHQQFITYRSNLDIPPTTFNRLKTAQYGVEKQLRKYFDKREGYNVKGFKVQGSKSISTMIRKQGDTVDIDFGIYFYPKPNVQPAFANYFIQYVRGFGAEGVKISAITIQNEPEFEPKGYPGMLMTAEEQRDFIKHYLGPKFAEAGIDTKVVVYDHNWDHPNYPISILDDSIARKYVDGSAFHCYGGDVANQSKVHDAHPDKNIYFTECSSGGWSGPWRDDLMWKFKNLFIGNMRNWATCVLLWNLALDENNGPTNGGCMDCRGVVTVRSNGTYEPTIDYYSLGHLSRFVRKGAVRIASTDLSAQNLDNVAFKNPDGSKVLVVMNNQEAARQFNVKSPEGVATLDIPAYSVVSFVWK